MTRGRIIGAIVALVLLGAIIGGIYLRAQSSVPEVTVVAVDRQDLGVTVSASGDVEADIKADVFPPSAGTIDEVKVTEGQRVKAGKVLAVLDRAVLEQQVAQARAAYEQAASQSEQIRGQAVSSADLAAQRANVAAAETAYDNAVRSLNDAREASRFTTSPAGVSSANQAIRQAETAKAQAYAGLLGARSQLRKLESSSIGSSLRASNANRDAAAEALRIARQNLEKADIKAPMDGVVIFNVIGTPNPATGTGPKASEGAAVSPQIPVFTIVELQTLRFNADVDEVDVPKLRAGMKGTITLDAFPGETFRTKVSRIQVEAVQTATGGTVFPVYLTLADVVKPILIGMKGDASIQTSAIKGAITVPVEAVLEDGNQSYVFVVVGETVERRNVKVGTLTDTEAQIVSGLSEGERVVVSNTGNLRDGMTVRVR